MIKLGYIYIIAIVVLIVASCNTSHRKAFQSEDRVPKSLKDFEGKVTYKYIFKDKTGQITEEQIKMSMGEKEVYTYKGGKYKSETFGAMKMTQLYPGYDTLYLQILGVDNLTWMDVTNNKDTLIDYHIEEKVDTILGIECDLICFPPKLGPVVKLDFY